jgi:hypothetical protein
LEEHTVSISSVEEGICSSERLAGCLPTSPKGVITQKSNMDIFTAVGSSDLTYYEKLYLLLEEYTMEPVAVIQFYVCYHKVYSPKH